jgi:hypothetical protein
VIDDVPSAARSLENGLVLQRIGTRVVIHSNRASEPIKT